jgi:hypothetical protein
VAARTMLQNAEPGEFSAVVMSLPGLAVERAN